MTIKDRRFIIAWIRVQRIAVMKGLALESRNQLIKTSMPKGDYHVGLLELLGMTISHD